MTKNRFICLIFKKSLNLFGILIICGIELNVCFHHFLVSDIKTFYLTKLNIFICY